MDILITGGCGFVGTEICKQMLNKDYNITCISRNLNKDKILSDKINYIEADIFNIDKYQNELSQTDIVIHLIGIIREDRKKDITFDKLHIEATKKIVEFAKNTNVKKIIHMSANGARIDATTNYHKTKFQAEQIVKNSGINFVIFRPSVIYGPKDIFINMLASFMEKAPVFSYFGKGDYPMQPVSVFEVAEIFEKSIRNEKINNKEFSICGNKVLTYKELLKLIQKIKNWNKPLIPIPEIFIKLSISLFGNQNWFPLTKDQFQMLIEGNTCQDRQIFEILDISSLNIEKVLKRYL